MPKAQTQHATGRYLSLLAALALIFFSGCSRREQGTYTIGYVGSQVGVNGAMLAAEQATSKKRSPYKAIKVVGIDNTKVDFNAAQAIKSLTSAGAQIVIDGSGNLFGAETSDNTPAILATGRDPKALATIHDPLEAATAKMADQLWTDKIYSVSVVYDLADRSYNWKWINAFRSSYGRHYGVILKAETINSSQEGWEKKLPGQVRNALIKETGGLLVVAGPEIAGMIVQEARNIHKTIPLALAEQAYSTVLLSRFGRNLEGAMVVDFPPLAGDGQSYEQFAKEYAGKFNAPANPTAASAYDAVGLIVTALEKGKRIADGFAAQPEYRGVLGTARNNSGTFSREVGLGRISNGRLTPLLPTPAQKP